MTDTKKRQLEQDQSWPIGPMLKDYLRGAVRGAIYALLDEELTGLCGPLHRPEASSGYYRAGSAPSHIFVDGRREDLLRPRVRVRTGGASAEVELQSWKAARDPAQWEETTMRAVLCGVSSRDVECLDPNELKGRSRSAVSRLWQRKAAELVQEVQQSDLSAFDLLVLVVDAVVLAKGLVATVALGIDTNGNKKILGYRVGGSENQQVCSDLLGRLSRRGLKKPEQRRLLALLDGSQALRAAVLAHYPDALVQRCLVHKQRNLRGYLSARHWGELARLFGRLRKAQGSEQAEEAAAAIGDFLKDKNAQARESFEEAGEDLLCLFHLEVPNTLNRSLLSTNCIENVFKNLRRHLGRVCRWRENTNQADRWMASGLQLAQIGFRSIVGCKQLPALIKALEQPVAQSKAA